MDLASRVYNHSFKLDPVIRSLLDTDFYTFTVGSAVHRYYKHVQVKFKVINRTKRINLTDEINEQELRDQLDHARTLRFQNNELVWLQGNTFYGRKNMFSSEFIEFLRNYQLPEYSLEKVKGQYELTFSGSWLATLFWEIPALAIINELRNRHHMQNLKKFELDILYSQAKTKIWNKLNLLKDADVSGIADFGTRRRHGFLFQEWAVLAASEVLGKRFLGTSNVLMAQKHGFEPVGTNSHQIPMSLACLANDNRELKDSQYEVLKMWETLYGGALLVMLPDTYGTSQFLKDAPEWVDNWTGCRIDSKDPIRGGEEMINWWTWRGQDPKKKLVLFSDGLDVDSIIELKKHFNGRARIGFGWGTLLTNDFRNCHPRGENVLDPISIVCKVVEANGRPAVKLSDNYEKATGAPGEIDRYRKVFGTAGIDNLPVLV